MRRDLARVGDCVGGLKVDSIGQLAGSTVSRSARLLCA